jgi:hypothetical protein
MVTDVPPDVTEFCWPRENETTGESNENDAAPVPTKAATVSLEITPTPTRLTPAPHETAVALDHAVVAQTVVSPSTVVGVWLMYPKFKPEMVTVPPEEWAPFAGSVEVRTGESYVNTLVLVPTKALTVTMRPI